MDLKMDYNVITSCVYTDPEASGDVDNTAISLPKKP